MSYKLYIIPTPIGNLEDLTFRALRILKEVDLILAEDTRDSAKLLKHYDIHTPMQSYHLFNEHQKVQSFVEQIKSGKTIALISDAGTPAISDPGFLLVRECVNANIEVECLPGATAFVPALVNSALPCERFIFEGFLPVKKGRQSKLEELAEESRTIILYEAPFRVVKTLSQLADYLGKERPASVSREISKLHEETVRGTLAELVSHFSVNEPRGEFVLIIEGKEKSKKRGQS